MFYEAGTFCKLDKAGGDHGKNDLETANVYNSTISTLIFPGWILSDWPDKRPKAEALTINGYKNCPSVKESYCFFCQKCKRQGALGQYPAAPQE